MPIQTDDIILTNDKGREVSRLPKDTPIEHVRHAMEEIEIEELEEKGESGGAPEPGINVPGDLVTLSTAHLPEDQMKLVRWLHSYAKARRWTWSELAEATGISSGTISRIWRNCYKDPRTKQPLSLESFCKKIATLRADVMRPAVGEIPYIETETWQLIEKLAQKCHRRHRMGLLFGSSQRGKTEAFKELVRREPGQYFYVEIPSQGGVAMLVQEFAKALMIPARGFANRLQKRVESALDSNKIVLVDEWHRVFEASFSKGNAKRMINTLRAIYDRTGCGMLFSMTDAIKDEFYGQGEYRSFLEQIRKRSVNCTVMLPDFPPRADLDAFAAHFDLPPAAGEAEKELLDIAANYDVRGVIETLVDGAEAAARKKEPLTWEHFIAASNLSKKLAGIAPQK